MSNDLHIQGMNRNVNNIDKSKYLFKLKYFLFCCNARLAHYCCCGCSLRVGVILIGVFGILGILGLTLSMIGKYILIPFAIITVFNFWGFTMMLISACNNSSCCSYLGYMILNVIFWLKILFYIVFLILMPTIPENININYDVTYYPDIVAYVYFSVYFIIDLALYGYFLWIIYSYTSFLAMHNINAINGIFTPEEAVSETRLPTYETVPTTI